MFNDEQLIRNELYKALESLGAPPKVLAATINGAITKDKIYKTAERLGADSYLLATIESWGDTIEDAKVLSNLKEWNAGAAAEAKQG
jgi:hypothetical protein